MTETPNHLSAILEVVEHGEGRSPLFWWMVKHHDDLTAKADGNRMRWTPLCATFATLGFTDTAGKPHTKRGAREIWFQARSYVSKRRATLEKAGPGKMQPSRLPATWKPTPADPPRAHPAPRSEPPRHTESPPTEEDDLPEDVRAKLAALDRQFEWADRFVTAPKKKD